MANMQIQFEKTQVKYLKLQVSHSKMQETDGKCKKLKFHQQIRSNGKALNALNHPRQKIDS